MKHFIFKLIYLSFLFVCINVLVLSTIPKDKNSYLCEYLRKIDLVDSISQPRIIFIGGSNVAFGIDSKRIIDSLNCNVINFGLHAGIGIRYPLEDYLNYAKKGDIVVLQIEYAHYYGGDNSNPVTFSNLMVATGWRNVSNLTMDQMTKLRGLCSVSLGRLIALIKYPITNSFDTPSKNLKFRYTLSGFNNYGDEISHFGYPSEVASYYNYNNDKKNKHVNEGFIKWLSKTLNLIEKKGAKVILIPPACTRTYFTIAYNRNIEEALKSINYPYLVAPSFMTLDDDCFFDAPYHINRNGNNQNTTKIIKLLGSVL